MHNDPDVQRLRAEAAKFRMLFEQASDAIFVVCRDRRLADVNERACRLLGYTRDELLTLDVTDVIEPQSLADAPLRIAELETGAVVRSTRRLVRKDGSTVEVDVRANGLTDGGFQAIATEIGDRERVREQLERHALMFETLLDAVIFADSEGRITDWNSSAQRMYGYSRDEVVGRKPTFLHSPSEDDVQERILAGVRANGSWRGEIGFVHRDGSEGVSETVVVAVHDAAGRNAGSIGVNRDITDRRRAAEELAATNRQRDLVLRSAGEGIWGLDADGRIAFVNPAAERMLGWSASEMLGRGSHDLTHHTRADGTPYPREECPIYRALRDGSASRVDDEIFWRKDGSSFPVSYTSTPIVEDGAVGGVVVVFRDISEQRELEAQLRQSQKIEAIGRLAGGIAHDFNNLLTAIRGYTELLGASDLREESRRQLDGIETAAGRAAELTKQLLAFTRQQVMEPVVIDVNEVIHDAEALFRRLIPENVRVDAVLAQDACHVKADPVQVTQVLMNLSLNARDAMPAGGVLTIGTERVSVGERAVVANVEVAPGEYVRIRVADDGSGMTEAVAARAFDPFFTTKPVGQGTGLGLATVYGIVKQSGGYVFVDSQEGEGSTFDVYLPATIETVEPDTAATASHGALAEAAGRVLLVEDEDVVRDLLHEALRGRGYEVTTASCGEDALASLDVSPAFDVVVTDIMMPGTSGREVAAAVRGRSPGAKIVYMSGYAREIVDEDPFAAGATFLQKPFSMRELVDKVDELLNVA